MRIRYSELQIALLSMLTETDGREMTLAEIEKSIYKKAHKRKPKTAHHAVSALIRSTSYKLGIIKAEIARTTPLGRGNEAKYALKGRIDLVKTSLEAYQ